MELKTYLIVEFSDSASLERKQFLLDFIRRNVGGNDIKSVSPIPDLSAPLSDDRMDALRAKSQNDKDVQDLLEERERLQTVNLLLQQNLSARQLEWMRQQQEIRNLKQRLAQLGESP